MPIKKIISSVQRSRRKQQVIKTILATPQQNDGVANVHRIDTKNIGDYFSAPHNYFPELKNTALDIFSYKSANKELSSKFIDEVTHKSLIIGGGGLLNRGGFSRQMKLFESLTQKGKKIALWGIGHNEKDPATFGKVKNYNVDVSKFGLAGTRDYSMPGAYVPCVSCMNEVFDKTYEVQQEIGVVFHKDTLKKPRILKKFKSLPSTSNTTDLDSLISFIGSSEKIITDSYHAMYWSMLMGKKVVVVPNSSKFYDFKYQPVISDFDAAVESLTHAQTYSGLLEECREINLIFSQKVFDYLNIS